MDQGESRVRQDIEETRTSMTEKIEMFEERGHETMAGTQSSRDHVMDNVKRVHGTVEETKSTVDNVLEAIKNAMDETIERVKYTSELIEQVHQNPWIMFGSAILTGYVLSSVNRRRSFDQDHVRQQDGDKTRHESKASSHTVA
jgi:ElaB/YqjD/DUF883 family membrane-anchored ribosome-binding protein